jgi:HAD-superfamily hydrolase, subfamily IIB
MKYTMLVLDLDDTLLKDDLTISTNTKRVLLSIQEKGVIVVIASGRPTYACIPIAKEIQLDKYGGFIIAFNGAEISSGDGSNILQSITIPKTTVHKLYEISKQYNVYMHTYLDNKIITPLNNPYTQIESTLTGFDIVETNNFLQYVSKEVVKVILLQDPNYLRAVFDNIKVAMSNSINMAFSKPFFLECMNDKADKAYGLNCLTQILQSSMENVIAVGDSYNDIPMIKQAGLGIAMENAVDALKQEAAYITKSNNDDGIVDIINKFIIHTNISL